jgi:uncharacterized protein involved in response to NO
MSRGPAPPSLFSYGFRPFFLLAGAQAVLSIALLLAYHSGFDLLPAGLSPGAWHAREMLFGYATAVLAGFLLTATPNWANTPPVQGRWLAGLAGLWLAGRLMGWLGSTVPHAAAAVDLAFVPALAVAILPALRAAPPRNRVFLGVLALLFVGNLLSHLDGLGYADTGRLGELLAVDLFALLIAVVGGRVVPAFTRNALTAPGVPNPVRATSRLDQLALAVVAAVVVADLVAPAAVAGAVMLLAALLQGLRMRGWATRHCLGRPILWVLHLGYAWLAIGFAWRGAALLGGLIPPTEALHGLTVGAVGTMTLAIMSRAALGHSGRPLVVPRTVAAAYLLVSVAAIARLLAPLLATAWFTAVMVSAVAWTTAFVLFLWVFAPILVGPRVDATAPGESRP